MPWTPPRTWVNGEIPTQTEFNTHVRDNTKEIWRELAYTEFSAPVTVSATTEATATAIVSAGAITFTADPIDIEFYAPAWTPGSAAEDLFLWLYDGTSIGKIGAGRLGTVAQGALIGRRRLTPTAAAHTYSIRAHTTATAHTVQAGTGGAGTYVPGFIRIMQKGG